MALAMSHKSALVLIPPVTLWPPIQEIRKEHDKAYDRWMPHINLLYPFVEDSGDNFEICFLKISSIIQEKEFKIFKIIFDDSSINFFKHPNNLNYHLSPSNKVPLPSIYQEQPVISLQSHLQEAFPSDDNTRDTFKFTAHLTLGQFKEEVGESLKKRWRKMEWVVDAVHLISRKGSETPFDIVKSIPLMPL